MGCRFLIPILAAAALAAPVAAADCRLEDYDPTVRPHDGPTDVAVGLYVADVVDVDDVEQSYRADFFVWLDWNDPRLGSVVAASGRGACKFPVADVWNPELDLFNRRELSPQLADLVSVQPDGRVHHVQRYQGSLRSSLDLRRFPLDRQMLPVTLISTEYGPEEVRLTLAPGSFRASEDMSVAGWWLERETHQVGTLRTRSADTSAEAESFVRLDYELHVARSARYYVWRAIIPLSLIVAMSWAIFWIDPSYAAVQIGLVATSMLTVVAFLFSLGNVLPRISYLTRLDIFLFAALSLVFLAFVQAVTTAVLAAGDREALAVSIDRKARFGFPLLFGIIQVVIWIA